MREALTKTIAAMRGGLTHVRVGDQRLLCLWAASRGGCGSRSSSIPRRRRGHATAGAVGIVATGGVLVAIGAFTLPGALHAKPEEQTRSEELPADAGRVRTMEALRLLLEESEALLAHHPATAEDPQRVVLWYADSDADGCVALGEVVVLTHHETTGTIAATSWDAELAAGRGMGGSELDLLEPSVVRERGFARRWAFRPEVRSRVIVTDLRSFGFEELGGADGVEECRVSLSWRGEATDPGGDAPPSADRGSMVIELHRAEAPTTGSGGRG